MPDPIVKMIPLLAAVLLALVIHLRFRNRATLLVLGIWTGIFVAMATIIAFLMFLGSGF